MAKNKIAKGSCKAERKKKVYRKATLPAVETSEAEINSNERDELPIKLTKQERRNLNKEKSKLNCSSTQSVKQASKQPQTTSVYVRDTQYPPTISNFNGPWDRFIYPTDLTYNKILDECYKGFVVSEPECFSTQFHDNFKKSFEGLDVEGFYQYDITQPAGLGTKTAKTFVTRCLVGDAGITYKYLGLRMFSVPWNEDLLGSNKTTKYAVEVGSLNKAMIKHSEKLLRTTKKNQTGSCQYNLTLINRYFLFQQ